MNNTLVRPIADPHKTTPANEAHSRKSGTSATQNALDHGIFSINPVIEGRESLEDWLAHRETVVRELCPVWALETLYAQRAALYLWRLNRVTRFEIDAKFGAIEAGSIPTCEDPANAQDQRISADPSTLQTIIKYEAHLLRCLAGTMAELRLLQKERRQGLRDIDSGGRGADRAGVCENEFIEKGSHGGSPSRQIIEAEMSISGGRGADRAGIYQNQTNQDGSHGGSPSLQITGAEMLISGGRGADRAGICENELIEKGSHGGSPSLKSSPSLPITGAEMTIPGGRGADRAGVCDKESVEKGSHGGSPSRQITGAEMSIPGGRGADRAGICIPGGRGADRTGVCDQDFVVTGSHGGSPSYTRRTDTQKLTDFRSPCHGAQIPRN